MSSLLTNSSAMTALQTLRSVSSQLSTTQSRISTGQRVATAADNAAYWSIATSMRADNAALSAVSDSLGLSAATVDTEYTALNKVLGDSNSGLTKLQSLLVEAKTAGIDRSKIQSEITQIQQDMKNVASAATFNGVNWLSTNASTPTTVNLVSSFSRVGSTPTTSSITVTVANYSLYTASTSGILDTVSGSASVNTLNIGALTDSAADQTILDGYIAQVTAAIGTVSSGAANLGAIKNRISNNSEFVKSLMDSVDRGIGQLVDADMNQESTRLAALQVQQQLGVQALSIANNNSQSILSLFR
ncbi:flagellin [Bradyrhizobium diazoefficiens]|jgi:flagellin|uniref:flagellin N-terminal helical domain-containing protein n=1 Tax=Bradyrhizobium TaxID=374 RepID=UPI0018872304|nr:MULTISPECIES: flagellin [Bradyrhizobium]MBR0699736.1 flagellin [Bradyrhizobium diazoefficiens]MBR0768071.1 flagellin [Bradyrhizobium diazoefficiens]MBR0928361.1 flagellin [Bradyrhizobium diazoefficiens]MCS3762608.1 flagellin [Bradyrhizobium centrosematis]MCS3775277.1 flagellin [Bradyrhizobium centrosematis]